MDQRLLDKINDLKKRRNAVILAHNYQPGEIQDIADFTGDSLGLSVKAANTAADVIVFCGVKFMAETAAILSPEKTVLLPEPHAGCPMAEMITAEQLRELKKDHPAALVVCYVNSTAEVKAQSDYCCTSANAVDLVRTLPPEKQIIFVPDNHLGRHVAEQTGREIILWPGYCATHVLITDHDILEAKRRYPDALVLAHPECNEPVKQLADHLLSTSQMLAFAADNPEKQFIIATEIGIIHSLEKQNPDTHFIPASERAVCANMKKITIDKLIASLEDMKYRVTVGEDIRAGAKKSLDRMIEVLPKK
ncbi:MAG: quinolinate synthase NadA [Sedimentisphaerales bacterium]|nr:quinolinate synthase NadA [Sedimentisphaerales bacterium]